MTLDTQEKQNTKQQNTKQWFAVKTATRCYVDGVIQPGFLTSTILIEAFSLEQAEEKAQRKEAARNRLEAHTDGVRRRYVFDGIVDVICLGRETPTDGCWVWTEYEAL